MEKKFRLIWLILNCLKLTQGYTLYPTHNEIRYLMAYNRTSLNRIRYYKHMTGIKPLQHSNRALWHSWTYADSDNISINITISTHTATQPTVTLHKFLLHNEFFHHCNFTISANAPNTFRWNWASSWHPHSLARALNLLFTHMQYGNRRRVRPNIRHLASLHGCACAFEEWVYGVRKVP